MTPRQGRGPMPTAPIRTENQVTTQMTEATTSSAGPDRLLRGEVRRILLMCAGLAVVVLVGSIVVYLNAFLGRTESRAYSVWDYVGGAFRFVILALMFVVALSTVPLLITHGVARRRTARAMVRLTVGVAGGSAVFLTAGFAVERAAYTGAGWPYDFMRSHLFGPAHSDLDGGMFPMLLLELVLLLTAYGAVGWLIGLAAYQLSTPARSACVVIGLVFLAGFEWLVKSWWFDDGSIGRMNQLPTWVCAVLGALVVALLVAAADRATKHLTIQPITA